MKAITTRYIGPTYRRGSRIKALAAKRTSHLPEISATTHYLSELSSEQNHTQAAEALATKMGWRGVWIAGGLPGDDGNVYVDTGRTSAEFTPWGIEGRDWFEVKEGHPKP